MIACSPITTPSPISKVSGMAKADARADAQTVAAAPGQGADAGPPHQVVDVVLARAEAVVERDDLGGAKLRWQEVAREVELVRVESGVTDASPCTAGTMR
jgi:hypothetical protein